MKKSSFITLAALLVVTGVGFSRLGRQNYLEQESASLGTATEVAQINETKLTIDFGNGKTSEFNFPFIENSSAFSVLKDSLDVQGLSLETEVYDFGVFVKSIDGYASSAEKAWIYYVNGESGQIAADKHFLNPGDNVAWKFVKPE
jgi:hypothetical protein